LEAMLKIEDEDEHEHDKDEDGDKRGQEARRDALPTTCKVERYNVVESAILPANASVY
jgi:hypothetical protein